MIILAIRTDKPEAELGLYQSRQQLVYVTWQAHRQLAETIHLQIRDILRGQAKELRDIEGVAVYKGPGSFTGLRIGISVANALAASLGVPIVSLEGEAWLESAVQGLLDGENEQLVTPAYGAEVHITPQKH